MKCKPFPKQALFGTSEEGVGAGTGAPGGRLASFLNSRSVQGAGGGGGAADEGIGSDMDEEVGGLW